MKASTDPHFKYLAEIFDYLCTFEILKSPYYDMGNYFNKLNLIYLF